MTDKILLEKLVKGLWEAYNAEIKSGLPVYFCFHKQQIQQIMYNSGLQSPDSFDRFLEISRTFLKIGRDVSEIDPSIYDPVWNEYSSAIILIAAQVVAVEMMDKDELGIGSDAYYLRLRKLISDQMNPVSRLPFFELEYLTLWDYFRREIIMFGGLAETITFSEGSSRKDKNRNFPISQSLLSQAELISVCSMIYASTNSIPRLLEIPELLMKIRSDLPNRVRFKVDRASQKFKIIEQIHAFYRKYGVVESTKQNSAATSTTVLNNISIRGFLEGLSEEICIFEAWDELVGKVDFQKEVVRQYFEAKPIVVLGRRSRNDFYWTSDVTGELAEFEDFLVVFTKNKESVFEYFLERHFNGSNVGRITRCELDGIVAVQFEKSLICENCLIRKGTPISGVIPTAELTIHGGIHLDYGNFLAGYDITGFSINGQKLDGDGVIMLDEREVQVGEALSIINQSSSGVRRHIQSKGVKKSICMIVPGSQREKEQIKYGYIIEAGVVEPHKSILQPHNSYFTGFVFTNNEIVSALTRLNNHIALIKKSKFDSGVSLTESEKEKVLFAISRLDIPLHLKKIMERNVTITGKVPARIFSYL